MSDSSISGQRGTSIAWRLTVTIPALAAPFDLTAAGVTATLTVKRSRSDATPLIQKTYSSANPAGEPAMLVADTNLLDIELPPAATSGFTATEFLVWDVIVTEGGTKKTLIADGALTVRLGIGS